MSVQTSMFCTVRPLPNGRLRFGLSAASAVDGTPDDLVGYVGRTAFQVPVEVEVDELFDAPIVSLLAASRLAAVFVRSGAVKVLWTPQHTATWRCFRARRVPPDHPLYPVSRRVPRDRRRAYAAMVARIFDPQLRQASAFLAEAAAVLRLPVADPEVSRMVSDTFTRLSLMYDR